MIKVLVLFSCTYVEASALTTQKKGRSFSKQIDNQHMTNESSDDVNGLLHHHPSWRSSGKLVVIQCKIEWLRITFVSHDNLDEV